MNQSKTILIVDDDKSTRDVLQTVLTKAGYHVTLESDVLDIPPFKIIPDIILLDNNLPDIKGISFCSKLKELPESRNIPVILVTASEELRESALLSGADDFINKPFGIDLLLEKIELILQRSQARDQTISH